MLYAGTYGGGVFKSTDAGAIWSATGMTSSSVYVLAIDAIAPAALSAGTLWGGVFKSTDSATTWHASGFVGGVICGDGIATCQEECEDGNLIGGDGCDSNCTATRYGNSIVTVGEECEDCNRIDGDSCTNACTHCGDGVVTPPEECDDGNLISGDCCTSDCHLPVGIVTGPVVNPTTGHDYYLLESASWPASGAHAVCLGGHPATINNQSEKNWVWAEFARCGTTDRSLWIGLSNEASEGTFAWNSGGPLTYTHWYPSEPNDCCGGQDYVHIYQPWDERSSWWGDTDAAGWEGGDVHGVVAVAPPPRVTPTPTPTASPSPSPSVTPTAPTRPSEGGGGGCTVTPTRGSGAAWWLLLPLWLLGGAYGRARRGGKWTARLGGIRGLTPVLRFRPGSGSRGVR